MSQKTKFIRTALGPKTIAQLKQESQIINSNLPITTLPYEHIFHNITEYLNKNPNIIDPKENIELSNLSTILKNPLSIYQNLYFEPDSGQISNELEPLKKNNCLLVCDTTNEKHGQNKKIFTEIQKISKINICFGISLNLNKFKENPKKYSNELQYLVVYGDDKEPDNEKLIPSFIGEEFLTELNDDIKNLYKMVIDDLINKYEIPLFIKIQGKNKFDILKKYVDFFNSNNVVNKSKIVFILGLSDNEDDKYDNEISETIENILSNNYSIILTTFDSDYSLLKENNPNSNVDLYFNKTKVNFFNKIITKNKKYIKLIMLSNNINYRVQLKKYGGFGYNNLFENYLNFILKGLDKENAEDLLCNNLLNLLCYWEPIEKFKKSVKMIKCENCGNEKEENDKDLFSKYDKNFCSFKCLKEWLSKNPQ